MVKAWQASNPRSPAAALMEIQYWIQRAWDARGHGYANTVTKEGWRLFDEHLAKAEALLQSTKTYAAQNPLWYRLYLDLALARGWSLERTSALFRTAVAAEPGFVGHDFVMIERLSPKWGGSFEQVDAFIQESVKRTRAEEGEALYARLYWAVSDGEQQPFNLFKDTRASWPRMKQGFEDMMKRYPDSMMNLNNYAAFACMAGDKKTYGVLRQRIGKEVRYDAWYANLTPEVCDHRFFPAI